MSEILGGAVTYLEGIFGSDTPSKQYGGNIVGLNFLCSEQKHTRQVAELLASQYPAMFQVSASDGLVPTYSGYGLGGLKGLKNLPERICNLVLNFIKRRAFNIGLIFNSTEIVNP